LFQAHRPIREGWIVRLMDGEIYISKTEAQIREMWCTGEIGSATAVVV
jgi:hypothetical protein